MSFERIPLAYPIDKGILPAFSPRTLDFHYNKHYAGYITKLNGLVKDTDLEKKTLEEIILATKDDSTKKGIFNNASQSFNHGFYFSCMKPNGTEPTEKIKKRFETDFGSFDEFIKQFSAQAAGIFGSGWCWLVAKDGKMEILGTSNSDNAIAHGAVPLLVVDVWEHAYYLDYQNRRPDSIQKFCEVIDWEFVEKQMEKAKLF
ncbi:superoxide dismutase [fe] 2 [Anaeramoeba ignava]|uniref:Superoxide dismutase n=1 Tax=Anaeramoeba ignava TaxID=1746090 RepID=A0A9Q0LQ37_ANAIG|nr:superoxide dismutase [fe] 2 [Anaeramoeba ignava]|eukprot:Anaeramoba_ignava/a351200_450.p1 GENE.a351200_450~~a351200_450.p1  ORF type:complete len:202 (+),score=79.58 a351200_450:46-651(+)